MSRIPRIRSAARAWLALALIPAAAGAQDIPQPAAASPGGTPEPANFIRPGQEGTFRVYEGPVRAAAPRLAGTLGERQLWEFDSPAVVSGMGKAMAQAADGAIWFVETREDKEVRIDPETLEMRTYQLPRGAAPYSIAIDRHGGHWLTAHGIEMLLESYPEQGLVIAHQPPSHGFLIHINVDQNDNVWFSQPGNNQLVRYSRQHGFREYPIPTPQSGPGRIDFDAQGNVWFPELYTNKLARLNPETGHFDEWDLPVPNALPAYCRVDRETGVVWVSMPMADRIASFTDGVWKEYPIPTRNSIVSTHVADENGIIWFTEGGWRGSAGGNKVGRMDTTTGEVQELEIATLNAQPLGMLIDRRGRIWFQESTAGKIGILTLGGVGGGAAPATADPGRQP